MIYKYTGKELAKVLIYYGIIGEVTSSDFKIVCPFHPDVNASMLITLGDGKFFCFGCGVSGYANDFVKLANPELNDLQACIVTEKILRSKEVRKLQIRYKKKRRTNNKQALIEAHDFFYGLRSVDWNNITTDEEHITYNYLKSRGFTARALNVADCRVNYDTVYPFIFPILDNGKFKGWVCRTTNKYVNKKRKYLYNEGFRKRDTLCGNYSKGCIPVICEGYLDYLSIRVRGGIKDSIAILGWHISDEQTEKLKRHGIKQVISALDNDNAGRKGTEYLKRFFDVIPVRYPDGVKDCGELDGKTIKKIIGEAKYEACNRGKYNNKVLS